MTAERPSLTATSADLLDRLSGRRLASTGAPRWHSATLLSAVLLLSVLPFLVAV